MSYGTIQLNDLGICRLRRLKPCLQRSTDCSGVYLEQGMLDHKKFEVYLRPNCAPSTHPSEKNIICISQLALAIHNGCSWSPCHPGTFWTQPFLYRLTSQVTRPSCLPHVHSM